MDSMRVVRQQCIVQRPRTNPTVKSECVGVTAPQSEAADSNLAAYSSQLLSFRTARTTNQPEVRMNITHQEVHSEEGSKQAAVISYRSAVIKSAITNR